MVQGIKMFIYFQILLSTSHTLAVQLGTLLHKHLLSGGIVFQLGKLLHKHLLSGTLLNKHLLSGGIEFQLGTLHINYQEHCVLHFPYDLSCLFPWTKPTLQTRKTLAKQQLFGAHLKVNSLQKPDISKHRNQLQLTHFEYTQGENKVIMSYLCKIMIKVITKQCTFSNNVQQCYLHSHLKNNSLIFVFLAVQLTYKLTT